MDYIVNNNHLIRNSACMLRTRRTGNLTIGFPNINPMKRYKIENTL